MPPDTETFTLSYHYERYSESQVEVENGVFTSRVETNIIDLGLIAPDGSQVGASGSDKTAIEVSETSATPGYQPTPLVPGEWQILLGAYKIAPEGVNVRYELAFTPKRRRLLKGDFHTHTLASDGVLTLEELAQHALRHGLDFLAITDHNQMVSAASFPKIPGMTLIPGIEWTHYQGHANFLGLERPYDEPFFTNTPDAALERFRSAHERGALIGLNHPFEENYGFRFDMETFPYDCLEIWNGPMRLPNLMAVGFWQGLLESGKKVPICGGSDYHRDQLFLPLGGPTTCVYALSASPADILAALEAGPCLHYLCSERAKPGDGGRSGNHGRQCALSGGEGNPDHSLRPGGRRHRPGGDPLRQHRPRNCPGVRGFAGNLYLGIGRLCPGRDPAQFPAWRAHTAGFDLEPDLFFEPLRH